MPDKRPRCKCGRPFYPTAREAQRAASRGSRQCDNPTITCTVYQCPHGRHHVGLHPRGHRVIYCPDGNIALTPAGALDLLDHLTAKHPDPTNPYTLFRCRHQSIHVARRSAMPADAQPADIPPQRNPRPT